MALLDDLLTWSGTLPTWQQDALRRLFSADQLTELDITELLYLLKVAHSIEPPGELEPMPLAPTHFAAGATGATVQLLSLSKLTDVNAFPDGRSLTFSPLGMTVVFGENGAGKSGYARVLKNACRARRREAVRPNAFDENRASNIPTAEVQLAVNGVARTFEWTQGGAVDADLASISVFDAACASDYIEEEGSLAFQPHGLAQVISFLKLCKELARRINLEIASIPCDASPFRGLVGETAVGRFIQSLSHESDCDQIRRLGTLSEEEILRIAELNGALAESNPEPRALTLDRLATRLEGLVTIATNANAYTTDRAVERLRGLVETNLIAKSAYLAVQESLQHRSPLPSTGSDVWRKLFSAAEQFSKHAYPSHSHPHVSDGALCVLCQTALSPAAQERMQAFSTFVSSPTATAADAAETALNLAMEKIGQANFTLGVDETLQAEIQELVPTLTPHLAQWADQWSARRTWMLSAVQTSNWEDRPALPIEPSLDVLIQQAAASLRQNALTLRRSADPQQRARLLSEQIELNARQTIAPHVPAVERHIQNCKKTEALRSCLDNLGSGPISTLLTRLADTYITKALLDAMLDELRRLGYERRTRHQVPRRTERGITLVRVNLDGCARPTEEVLSEGEQRATALAFFLAEMRLASDGAALVFDDPVTSMDHRYRKSVAKRLTEIANDRQVIVFTHDAVFLMALHHASALTSCEINYRTVEWDSAPGNVIDGLGWDHMKSGQRVNALKQQLSSIRDAWGEYPSEESKKDMTNAYTHLRGTIERIIREDLVNGVIQPYSDEVNVENFSAVVGVDPAEWNAVLTVYDHACEVTRAHDTTSEQQISIPNPERLQADISVLELAIASASARRKAAAAARSERGALRRSNPASA